MPGPCGQDVGSQNIKNYFDAKIIGSRKKTGRPKLRQFDDAQNDIKEIGVKSWGLKAQDRFDCKAVIRKVKVMLKGPYSTQKKKKIFEQ